MTYPSYVKGILGLHIGLVFVLVLNRAEILDLFYSYVLFSPGLILKIFLASFNDIFFVSVFGVFFLGLSHLLRKRKRMLNYLFLLFLFHSILQIFIARMNVIMLHTLGVPFNYRWMYYSDIMENGESLTAVLQNFTSEFLYFYLFLCLIMGSVAFLNFHLINRISRARFSKRQVLTAVSIVSCSYFIAGIYYNYKTKTAYEKLANPVVAFVKSTLRSPEEHSNLFKAVLPDSLEKFPVYEGIRKHSTDSPFPRQIQNVILFVMESVSAQYVSGYDPAVAVTPNLERYLGQALVFSDVYAHVPSTNNSLVSMMGSIYPMMSYKSMTSETPDFNWPTLSSELKKSNFRTGFFHSSDNRFQRMGKFLSYRRFDTIMDYRDIPCSGNLLETDWEYLNGVEDECMVNAFTNWLEENSSKKPFFATLWTMQTHYPYFLTGKEKNFVKDEFFNRYLNALHYSDSLLGDLLDRLDKLGLAESTLVVVVGDHGEAFGQHGQYGHGSHIYDENLRVPLIFINPVLFNGEKKEVVGGHIDLAPTLMEVLKLPSPFKWQGTSLFAPDRLNRSYFFSPYSEYLFGYRTPEHKVIYNASKDEVEIFHMLNDPKEQLNLVDEMPDFKNLSLGRLARWIQFQNDVIKEISEPQAIQGMLK